MWAPSDISENVETSVHYTIVKKVINGVLENSRSLLSDRLPVRLHCHSDLVTGENPTRIGNRYGFVYPYDTFRTRDGWVAIGVGNDEIWQRFCEAIGMQELSRDPGYQTNAKRVREHESLNAAVTKWTSQRTTQEAVFHLLNHKIPAAPVYTVKDIVDDPHIARAREMIVDIAQPEVGRMKIIGCPIKMPGTGLWSPAPRLGEHTTEVLTELLKMTGKQIEKLKEEGAT